MVTVAGEQLNHDSQTPLFSSALLAAALLLSSVSIEGDSNTIQCDAAAFSPSPSSPSATNNPSRKPRNVMLHRMRSIRARNLEEKYNVNWAHCLGEGAYGSVHPARLAATGEKVALKKISKRYTNSSSFKTETDALLRIYDNGGHPNISGLRDMYEDYSYFYLILDLVSGGEMFEHLINYGAYSEADAARLMHEVASALAFLHGVGVVHADLKPENLLLCSKNRLDGTIKIIDFGCAVAQSLGEGGAPQDKKPLTKKEISSTGTTAYWPPERFEKNKPPNAPMDMWSVGVILYIMLCGVHPFDIQGASTDEEMAERIQNDPSPPLDPEYTSHLSDSAIDLIKKLINKDPKKRLTAYEMLQHPWVRGETATKDKMRDSDKKLSQFKDLRQKLEAGVFTVLVQNAHKDYTMSEAKIDPDKRDVNETSSHIMKTAFDMFDAEGKGYVTSGDLGRVVKESTGSHVSSTDTKDFIATSRTNSHGDSSGPSSAENLSLSEFSSLFKGIQHQHFPRGHVIFHAGDKGEAMYFLNSGRVEVQTRKGQLVAILRSGDFFGEGSLLDEKNTRFTTAKCSTPVDVLRIKREEFDRYVASSKDAKRDLRVKWRARQLAYAKNLIRLQTNVKTRVLKKGDVVYREGDRGESMFRVFDVDGGTLEVTHGGATVHSYSEGESFGESSLLFDKVRSSTVTCVSEKCQLHEMLRKDFLALVESSPEMANSMKDMCRKRMFKKAVKNVSLQKKRGLTDDDIVAVFHDADLNNSGSLSSDEVRNLMHKMDPTFPEEDISALMKFIDVDEDGLITLEEFKRLFRQFEKFEVQRTANV